MIIKAKDLIKELQKHIDLLGEDVKVAIQGGEYGEDQNTIRTLVVEHEHFNPEDTLIIVIK